MSKEILAPMPGKIIEILVEEGDQVEEDQELLILEAMKMENVIAATDSGKISEIKVRLDDTVNTNQVLVVLE